MIKLNELKPNVGSTRNRKRLGRGSGSGHGPTAGKGDKGQLARSGGSVRAGFEGGQTPLYRRLPKFGFKPLVRKNNFVLNLSDLGTVLEMSKSGVISAVGLRELGLMRRVHTHFVVLGTGALSEKVSVKADRVSSTARAAIEKLGGVVEIG